MSMDGLWVGLGVLALAAAVTASAALWRRRALREHREAMRRLPRRDDHRA